MTRSWEAEYGPAGVCINAVALIRLSRTEVTKSMGEMLDTFAAASPLGRAEEPDEVAHVIAYLAGEQVRPITGTVLAVDAGCVSAL
ncbi:SDR family oxidoreductase [Streptomyces prunicolor]|uniref:SDR family oxidoreductase n=1 Tax=Streptomyces prunicolor TaxID=67348 RepID=UPI003421A0A1